MDVRTIAVIGAGTMGRGIAYASALGGFRTVLEDVSDQVLTKAMAWIGDAFEEGVKRGKVEAAVRDAAMERISTSMTVEGAISDAELVIEAVPEDVAIKGGLFRVLEQRGKAGAIFASNTSSLAISSFVGEIGARERCIGMHFFNPVPKMKLVEIVRTPHTSEETVAACVAVAHRMHKETVIVNEAPGFITSRMNALIGNEAFAMLEAGTASAADIDKAIKLGLNHPMGPFELVDLVGLDVRLSILEYLHETLGEKYRPNALLRKYVEEGRLGRKTGRGVYDYSHHDQKHGKS
ncbi:MAG TPA: 3-hydroxyacyl-CoA dehydrogenase NAD-binding domain-containing protein [Candidatus Saccharimonadales bacterium]|nr:3-hydroxyacyl-CoA dehydrogenase NAD-binding domain-containing protein [Candidatus Saccharimonadales bacterium]